MQRIDVFDNILESRVDSAIAFIFLTGRVCCKRSSLQRNVSFTVKGDAGILATEFEDNAIQRIRRSVFVIYGRMRANGCCLVSGEGDVHIAIAQRIEALPRFLICRLKEEVK